MNCSECTKPVDKETERWVEWHKDGKVTRIMHQECSDDLDRQEFKKTGRLTSHLTLVASLSVYDAERYKTLPNPIDKEVNDACERLRADFKRLEAKAWFGGVIGKMIEHRGLGLITTFERVKDSLQSIIEDSKFQTVSAKLDDFTVTCQDMAGRCLIELESKRGRITLIVASREQTARMGLQGIDGTEDECRRMIATVTDRWRELVFKNAWSK